jgi:hypothetical protein
MARKKVDPKSWEAQNAPPAQAKGKKSSAKKAPAPRAPERTEPDYESEGWRVWFKDDGKVHLALKGEPTQKLRLVARIPEEIFSDERREGGVTVSLQDDQGFEWVSQGKLGPSEWEGRLLSADLEFTPAVEVIAEDTLPNVVQALPIDHFALARLGELACKADPRLAEELARAIPALPALLRGVEEGLWRR